MGRVSFCLESQLPKWISFSLELGVFPGPGSEIDKPRDGGLGGRRRASPLKELGGAPSPGPRKAEARAPRRRPDKGSPGRSAVELCSLAAPRAHG